MSRYHQSTVGEERWLTLVVLVNPRKPLASTFPIPTPHLLRPDQCSRNDPSYPEHSSRTHLHQLEVGMHWKEKYHKRFNASIKEIRRYALPRDLTRHYKLQRRSPRSHLASVGFTFIRHTILHTWYSTILIIALVSIRLLDKFIYDIRHTTNPDT